MIIGKELSSYTYTTANWVLLCRCSRSIHTYRTKTLCFCNCSHHIASIFGLLAPSMHWRCTEERAKCTSCVSLQRGSKLHACIYKDIVQEGVVALTFETIAG